jgi:diguanylate cyclase (GGDEF)-like protein
VAEVEDLVLAGRHAEAARIDTLRVDSSARALAKDLSALEEAASVASKTHLAAASNEGRWLSGATPVVVGGSLIVALLLFNVLRRYRRGVEALATTDPLTGLPNRLALARSAAGVLDDRGSNGAEPSLLLLDLDRFKEVNDSLGHHYGDVLLVEVAHRLRSAIKREDVVARLGGDEFAILLSGGGERVGRLVADRVRTVLRQPFTLDQLSVDVDVSVGIAVANKEAPDLPALLRCADVAMYVAKETGDGAVVYTRGHDARIGDKVRLVSELRRALDHDELVLHFQPKVALDDGRLLGVEALVRWQHPTRGLLAPGEFLPPIDEIDLMDRITTDVLTKALRQGKSWADQGHQIPVAVNIPTRSLHNFAFPNQVSEMLKTFNIPAELLCLEITESSAMRDPERCITVLEALRAHGVRISIDDYGTGYASMAYLKNLPVDELKIDRSFIARVVEDPQSAILARSIVELGHNLGLTVVGEGVEDATVGAFLRETGCDSAQGFHYARPMPGDDLLPWQSNRATAAFQAAIPEQRRPDPEPLTAPN